MANVTRPATAHEQAALRAASSLFKSYVETELAPAVGGALELWKRLGPVQLQLPAEVRARNAALQDRAARVQSLVRGLQSGELELAGWQSSEQGEIQLGIVSAGALGFWPVVITVIAVGALIGTTWKALDAWSQVQGLKAEAELVRAQTAKSVQDVIATADPNKRTALAMALSTAQQAANAVGSSWASSVAATYAKSAAGVGVALFGLWWLYRRFGGRRA